jgi:hypothetical protein
MELTDQVKLAIMLLKKRRFSNAYDLCKVLSRIFNIINCQEIILYLLEEKFVDIEKIEYQVKHFLVTAKGFEFEQERKDEFISFLKSEYPHEYLFIDNLIS